MPSADTPAKEFMELYGREAGPSKARRLPAKPSRITEQSGQHFLTLTTQSIPHAGADQMLRHTNTHCYTWERHTYGWLLRGNEENPNHVPVEALSELRPIMPPRAILDAGIAHACQAVFAITTEHEAQVWRREIEETLRKQPLPDEVRWARGTDTGLSSMTIFLTLAPQYAHELPDPIKFQGQLPRDTADFARCHRLLERFPAWRNQLHKVAERFPAWKPLVARWAELTQKFSNGNSINQDLEELTSG